MAKLSTNLSKDYKSIKGSTPPSVRATRIYRILLYISLAINLFLVYELHKYMK